MFDDARISPQAPFASITRARWSGPVRVRMGGTLPVSELFLRILGIYTVFFSFSTADEDFHAPNEFFRINRLHEGLAAWATYWSTLGGE